MEAQDKIEICPECGEPMMQKYCGGWDCECGFKIDCIEERIQSKKTKDESKKNKK